MTILGTLFLPVAIAFAGCYYSLSMKAAEIAAADRRALADEEVARINSRVGQAGPILQYLGELFHTNPQRRDVATRTIQNALPDIDSSILYSLSQSTSTPSEPAPALQAVTTALDQRRTSLVGGSFLHPLAHNETALSKTSFPVRLPGIRTRN